MYATFNTVENFTVCLFQANVTVKLLRKLGMFFTIKVYLSISDLA